MKRGAFISFEGGEGTGKSTQIRHLSQTLTERRIPNIVTREPGGSPGAEQIRDLLVTGGADRWSPLSETLLFYAARVDHWHKVIRPAIDDGKLVLCDRFADSTMAYQAYAGGMERDRIEQLHALVLAGVKPDLTIILDLDPGSGLARAQARPGAEARFESKGLAFHERLRAGFLDIARRDPVRCRVLDADRPVDAIAADIIRLVDERLQAG